MSAWLHLLCPPRPAPPGARALRPGDDLAAAAGLLAFSEIPLAGVAGLERLGVWARARRQFEDTGAAVAVDLGDAPAGQLDWLRLLHAPGELSDLIDAVEPRVERHREMPEVFGRRARRARLLERTWARGTGLRAAIAAGQVLLHPAAADDPVAAAASFTGVHLAPPGPAGAKPLPPPRPLLSAPDYDDAGRLLLRLRLPLPAALADRGAPPARARAGGGVAVVRYAGWSRRITLPPVLGACELRGVRTRIRRADSGGPAGGDILLSFRSLPGLLPRGA
ncbi:hypothetical protein [Corynebacterium sphenisci]|uniref:hypothetical protein n=1 Tax=Corynebacterium sphenisci TaxID=191493 RepID=UPI0026DEF661|nr:hypothetical protein [Corynebacterium sphenisci]MDO5731674.1 hypothetical protein [Corynebacterium sphenisci]